MPVIRLTILRHRLTMSINSQRAMSLTRFSLRLLPDEYDNFLAVIRDDPRLPSSYDRWLKQSRHQDGENIRNGEVINEVVATYKEFAAYCEEAGTQPCYDMLLGLMMTKGMNKP